MNRANILFDVTGNAITPRRVRSEIDRFPYRVASFRTIRDSARLDRNGRIFIECSARILSSFGMTRSGPFKGVKIDEEGRVHGETILLRCWEEVGQDILEIRHSIQHASRDRYLLELGKSQRDGLIERIWKANKRLLPITMGANTYGLVGASKILFAVLPELVLPVDTAQWRVVFKTVDIGDVIERMATDIENWERATGQKLNQMDSRRELTTLPSAYNVMAMAARP